MYACVSPTWQSVESMECEISNLKCMYEGQISKLRSQLEEFSREKSQLQLEISRLGANAAELQIRSAR